MCTCVCGICVWYMYMVYVYGICMWLVFVVQYMLYVCMVQHLFGLSVCTAK